MDSKIEATIDNTIKVIRGYENALKEIAAHEGQTLLGQSPEHEYVPNGYPEEDRAHEAGANKAFDQCAAIAKRALTLAE